MYGRSVWEECMGGVYGRRWECMGGVSGAAAWPCALRLADLLAPESIFEQKRKSASNFSTGPTHLPINIPARSAWREEGGKKNSQTGGHASSHAAPIAGNGENNKNTTSQPPGRACERLGSAYHWAPGAGPVSSKAHYQKRARYTFGRPTSILRGQGHWNWPKPRR